MEEGAAGTRAGPAPARKDTAPTASVLYSQALRSLMGGECLQILRCSICMEFFNIPIVLPCGHTFCLQCLTEMCRHAIRSRAQNPLRELLIGCPNCRVQIFAKPILERNVTCNFIIQSLIDMLRNRQIPATQDSSVNTDRSLLGGPVRAVSQEVVCGVLRDVDRLTSALNSRSVVDDAFFEIESIRRQHADFKPTKTLPGSSMTGYKHTDMGTRATSPVPCRTLASSGVSPLNSPRSNLTCSQQPPQVARRGYAMAVTYQPPSAPNRTQLQSGLSNQYRPGFRNKNRNNVDRSPPEFTAPGEGAHCIAKIFPEVTAFVKRRHSDTRGTEPACEDSSETGECSLSVPGKKSDMPHKSRHLSLIGLVYSEDQALQSASSIAVKKRLVCKRTEKQRAHFVDRPSDSKGAHASGESLNQDSVIPPKKPRSPDTYCRRTDLKKSSLENAFVKEEQFDIDS